MSISSAASSAAVAVLLAASLPACAQTAPQAASPAPAAAPASSAAAPTTIRFTFETGAQTGKIMVALYNSAETYSDGAPVASTRVDVAAGSHEAVFPGLAPGDYAMKAFHDVDGDGKMNTNPFGMPTEPYAFSNSARGNMGPASWERAHFAASGAVAQTISIR